MEEFPDFSSGAGERMRWLWRDVLFQAIVIATLTIVAAFFASRPEAEVGDDQSSHGSADTIAQTKEPKETVFGYQPDSLTAFSTFALAFLTFVLAGVGVSQVIFLQRADKTARISAEAARDSANVARDTLATQRPWLSIDAKIIDGIHGIQTRKACTTVHLIIQNIGSSPATRVLLESLIVANGNPLIQQKAAMKRLADRDKIGPTIFSGSSQELSLDERYEFEIPEDEHGMFALSLVGCVGYGSSLSEEGHYVTPFMFHIIRFRPPNRNAQLFFLTDNSVPADLLGIQRALIGNDLKS